MDQKVCVRKRPLFKKESEKGDVDVIRVPYDVYKRNLFLNLPF